MSQVLLDTHTFIWFVSDNANLPNSTRKQIESAESVFFSMASLWEMAIKLNIGKLPLQGTFEEIEPQLAAAGMVVLPITFADIAVPYRVQYTSTQINPHPARVSGESLYLTESGTAIIRQYL